METQEDTTTTSRTVDFVKAIPVYYDIIIHDLGI